MGGQSKFREALLFDPWTPPAASAPQGSDDHFVFVKRVVEMAIDLGEIPAAEARDRRLGVGCANAGKKCQ